MDAIWFYAIGDGRHGPVAIDALKAALLAAPDPRRVLVWRDGMSDWAEAATLPELSRGLPPQMPRPPAPAAAYDPLAVGAPFPPPPPHFPPADPTLVPTEVEEIETVARHYRRLVGLVGGQLLVGFGVPIVTAVLPPELAALVALATLGVAIVLIVTVAITAYRLSDGIQSGVPVLWALAMFVPCFNLLGLLILSSQAQTWCKVHHVEVGFLGPTQGSLDRLRRERR